MPRCKVCGVNTYGYHSSNHPTSNLIESLPIYYHDCCFCKQTNDQHLKCCMCI